jgi:hypothetical protein
MQIDFYKITTMLPLLVLILAPIFAISAALPSKNGKEIRIRAGENIQAAINSAQAGDRINVEAGTYREQLTISTNGVTLEAHGAILFPPKSAVLNTCSGLAGNDTQTGICITGSSIGLANYEQEHRKVLAVGSYVKGVSVTGFEIHDFAINIAAVGAKDTIVAKNKLYNGGQYGFLTVGSQNTVAFKNKVTATDLLLFIGMCMDDTSPAKYTGNYVSGYLIAFCLQTVGAIVKANTAENNCVGAFLDPGVGSITFARNVVKSLDPRCPPSSPEFSTGGVIIFGAPNAKVVGNTITGMQGFDSAAGILLADAPGMLASSNIIKGNILEKNDVDIFLFTNATDNIIKHNQCALSSPTELCFH